MKHLYNYSKSGFDQLVEENNIHNWWIYNKSIDERHDAICNKEYYSKLKTWADRAHISYNEAEIVSWIDGMCMLYYALNDEENMLKNLRIIGELHIPFSNCRADCVLVMDNKILIIEFTYKNNNQNRKKKYEEKLNQVIYYKELLSNALPKHIEIATYSFPIEVETDEFNNPIYVNSDITKEQVSKNHDNCYYLGQFIKKFFKTTQKTAMDELYSLDDKMLRNMKKKSVV